MDNQLISTERREKYARIRDIYRGKEYLDAYAIHTDLRVQEDPRKAIGGMWEEIGRLQFNFLIRQGMGPGDSLLDIGCGTLRGGRLFIPYLNKGNYCGIDISPKAIEFAKNMVEEDIEMSIKEPEIFINGDKHLTFDCLNGRRFQYILAQSVINHLPPHEVAICFNNFHKVMGFNAKAYITYMYRRHGCRKKSSKDWQYSLQYLSDLLPSELKCEAVEYGHPRGMRMMRIEKND